MGLFEFFKKNKKYDSEGFDSQGYNRLGYDRMGYDKNGYDINGYNREGYNENGIYKLTGRDKDGYDENGFDENGFNREGFDKDGYNLSGYDKSGFNRYGYDKDGYNQNGFDHLGYDKQGYDLDGYARDGYNKGGYDRRGYDRNGYDQAGYDIHGIDKEGYNREGYDSNGYNREGYDSNGYNMNGYDRDGYDRDGYDKFGFDLEGYDRDGYDKDGYNRKGFDKTGYNREGYNKDGFNKRGYDKDGYNQKGFNILGYDRDGYDKHGYDKKGYNRSGYNKSGYDKEGYDEEGFNHDGVDRSGYNKEGYDRAGYNKEGYNKSGFNRDGFSKFGMHQKDFDEEGYHKITGLDVYGYSKYGFNINGINKYTGRDRLGFDSNGIDEKGYNIWGFNEASQTDRFGNPLDAYLDDPKMSTELCDKFGDLYYQYMGGKKTVAIALANCYCSGTGTIKDYKKALRILIDVAIEYQDIDAIRELADHFYIGDIIGQNIALSKYFNDIVDNKKIQSINQYKSRQALEFQVVNHPEDRIYNEESEHLKRVINSLERAIQKQLNQIRQIDDDPSWMDWDQRQDWIEKKSRNVVAGREIDRIEKIKNRPYYARMDAKTSRGKECFYIGEEAHSDYENPACRILSVWSEVGSRYRDSNKTNFSINGHEYNVVLRRKLDVQNGYLLDYYDEYNVDSDAAQADITNPFLLRILEQKRGEKNITNIIRTIQVNQNDIIEADFQSNIIVQGCAGSGKTMILLHRLANMKYNQKNYDWSKVKIITPNKDFALFIDDLSKNLKIEEIEKITLQEYYISILEKYEKQYPKRIKKGNNIVNVSCFNYKDEIKKIMEDELEREILLNLYSEDFRNKVESKVKECKKTVSNYGDACDTFAEFFISEVVEMGGHISKKLPNYLCYLYSKVLFMFFTFGPIHNTEKMLCIDEGQDISELQYRLLFEVNNKKTCLNIYGDLEQKIPGNVSISSWDTLKNMMSAKYFELNENYRNSEEIIDFYGKRLGIKNGSFGLKTKEVEHFVYEELDILLKMQLLLGNRTVVITNSEKSVPQSVLGLCKIAAIVNNHVSIMNVKQVKGLEFDTAFVFDEDMDKNERYIAYTRALSELYVSSSISGSRKKALDIKKEKVKSNVGNKKNESMNRPEFPSIKCNEVAKFYDHTALYNDGNIYITLTYPVIIKECFVLKMALRINKAKQVSKLVINAKNFKFNEELRFDCIPVYIQDNDREEQIITLAIPLNMLSENIANAVQNRNNKIFYGFLLEIEYTLKGNLKHRDNSSYVLADMRGEFCDGEENADGLEDTMPQINNNCISSIVNLDEQNDNKLLIVVRHNWSNDFCFVVEKFDGQMARGKQYLNGSYYADSAYNKFWKQFAMYTGPSREKIENMYE